MKKFYLFEIAKNGKRRAYAVGVPSGDNLLKVIKDEGESLVSVYPFSSAAKADEVADIWNDEYIKQGIYLLID